MIIAECGLNHNGDMELAKKMICEAKNAGANLVKFQLYDADKDEPNNPWHTYLKQCELSFDQAKMLFDYGKEVGIEVFFSVDNVERVEWCEKIGVKRYKIGYGHRGDLDLYKIIIPTRKPLMVSVDVDGEGQPISYGLVQTLYCVPLYPTSLEDLNFNARSDSWDSTNTFDLINGFSDHTVGLDAAKIALAREAEIIEKHFTLDKSMYGPDHCVSMTPDELKELVRGEKVCKEVL